MINIQCNVQYLTDKQDGCNFKMTPVLNCHKMIKTHFRGHWPTLSITDQVDYGAMWMRPALEHWACQVTHLLKAR